MKHITLGILVCSSIASLAGGRLTVLGVKGGERYYTTINHDVLKDSSAWNLDGGDLPLSAQAAYKLATVEFKKDFPAFGEFDIDEIRLKKSRLGTWLYYVTYVSKPNKEEVKNSGGSKRLDRITYFVLLNSKVISPKKKSG